MPILKDWLRDMPQQFQGKEKIEILANAFAKQMSEIEQVYTDLNEKTLIDTATGKTLDYIGDILSLTRRDATEIVRKAKNVELNDELYRKTLKWQALKSTSECSYEDIVKSVMIMWDTDNLSYIESAPAVIDLDLGDISIEDIDPAVNRTLAIKPSGVLLYYTYSLYCIFYEKEVFKYLMRMRASIFDAIYNMDCPKLDGSYQLDGTLTLNSTQFKDRPMRMRVIIKINEPQPHEKSYDGSWTFDGTQQFLDTLVPLYINGEQEA